MSDEECECCSSAAEIDLRMRERYGLPDHAMLVVDLNYNLKFRRACLDEEQLKPREGRDG